MLAGLTSGEMLPLVVLGLIGLLVGVFALRRLTPAGTLRAARGLPAAVLMRGIITFAFFAVDAYVALALVEWRGLSAAEAGIALTAATSAGRPAPGRRPVLQALAAERFVRAGLLVLVVGARELASSSSRPFRHGSPSRRSPSPGTRWARPTRRSR